MKGFSINKPNITQMSKASNKFVWHEIIKNLYNLLSITIIIKILKKEFSFPLNYFHHAIYGAETQRKKKKKIACIQFMDQKQNLKRK